MNDLKALFAKYMNDSCTTAEIKLLMQTFKEAENEVELKEAITAELQKDDEEQEEEALLDAKMLKIYSELKPLLIKNETPLKVVRPIRTYFKYSVAAAVLVLCSVFAYLYFNAENEKANLITQNKPADVNPGGNKAVLTLADGSEISLTDAGNGELARQAGIRVTKSADGQIVYEVTGKPAAQNETMYNMISTPAGGQYQINLPDGSKVWLNAESSLKYPTVFNKATREVELKGEAYFEIARNVSMPFVVSTNTSGKAQQVTVLGTHFNINSYTNEKETRTTLLEGKVKVAAGGESKTLQPGQQAILGETLQVANVDPMLAVDWKNGNFYFNDESIYSIMRKLARWYDIEVIYQGNVPDISFGAEMTRDKKLTEVLKVLERAGGIHFKIEGRRVTVMQ